MHINGWFDALCTGAVYMRCDDIYVYVVYISQSCSLFFLLFILSSCSIGTWFESCWSLSLIFHQNSQKCCWWPQPQPQKIYILHKMSDTTERQTLNPSQPNWSDYFALAYIKYARFERKRTKKDPMNLFFIFLKI